MPADHQDDQDDDSLGVLDGNDYKTIVEMETFKSQVGNLLFLTRMDLKVCSTKGFNNKNTIWSHLIVTFKCWNNFKMIYKPVTFTPMARSEGFGGLVLLR